MRILVFNWLDRRNPTAGGAEAHLHEIFGRLASRGHAVVLVAAGFPGAADREVVDGIEIHRVGSRWSYPLHLPAKYRALSRTGAFDVVVEDLNKLPLLTPRWVREPVLVLAHHLFGSAAPASAGLAVAASTWAAERLLLPAYRDSSVQAVSRSTALDLVDHGIRPDRIEIVHNGVDTGFYRPDAAAGRSEEPSLLYVGRLVAAKRVDLPIRAMARLRDRGVPATLLIAGTGPEAARLHRLTARLGLAGRVRFLGWVDDDEKRRLYRRAWIHLLTSRKEGWGLSVMEAAACGTPTVGSSVAGLWDSVLHRQTGVLLPHGDHLDLARELATLIADRDTIERMGRAARSHALTFSWEAASDLTERRLRSVVAEHRETAACRRRPQTPVPAATETRSGPPGS